ncbi:hypothetical protein HDR58_06110 [bacterium]|nr:hypothetical protein [bacterium]
MSELWRYIGRIDMGVVIFGSGYIGEKVYKRLGDKIKAVIDNDKKKVGQKFHDIPIISLANYKEKYCDLDIIIAVGAGVVEQISHQLDMENINNYSIAVEVYEHEGIYTDQDIEHDNWSAYLKQLCDKPGYEVLEVGSRVVTESLI